MTLPSTDCAAPERTKRGRQDVVSVRFSAEEKQRITEVAHADGLDPAAWLRYHALRLARREEPAR